MKKIKPDIYTQTKKKLICDWSYKEKHLIQYKMLKFYVRLGMVVEKGHEIYSLKQSKWVEKNICFNTQKRNHAVNDFEKAFYKLISHAFDGKSLEIIRNTEELELTRKDDFGRII